jgi:hypothetical protein
MINTFRAKVFYELIVEDEFEFEAEVEQVLLADIVVNLLAHERLRTLRVTDTTELGPGRMLIKDLEFYGDCVCECNHIEGDTE